LLKNDLLRATRKTEIPNPNDDIISGAEVYARHVFKKLLADDLQDTFEILDNMKNKDNAKDIYKALERVARHAFLVGTFSPSDGIKEYRKKTEEWARRAKRKANVAAKERREKMLPSVEDFLQVNGFPGLAIMYKALMKRPEFVSVLPKNVNPRQIKGDIEAILTEIETAAELAERWPDLDKGASSEGFFDASK
jgi:hypothetical protein